MQDTSALNSNELMIVARGTPPDARDIFDRQGKPNQERRGTGWRIPAAPGVSPVWRSQLRSVAFTFVENWLASQRALQPAIPNPR